MRHYILLLISAVFSIPISAQDTEITGSVELMWTTQRVDVREYAYRILNDESLMSKVSTRGTADSDTAVRWIDRLDDMPDYYRSFYDTYSNKVDEVLSGGSNWLTDPTQGKKGTDDYGNTEYYINLKTWNVKVPFNYPADITNQWFIQTYIYAAISDSITPYDEELSIYFPYLCISLDYDMPQAFWTNNCGLRRFAISYVYTCKDGSGTADVKLSANYVLLNKSENHSIYADGFDTPQAIADGVTEYHQLIDSILTDLPDRSVYYQAMYLNDWLTEHNAYSTALGTDSVKKIVWNPMSALRGTTGADGPVCEGYARAFKILCNTIGIPAVLAVGEARSYKNGPKEAHMWNEVKMNDGYWYAVDVTWNDPVSNPVAKSGFENHDWFILSNNTVVNGMKFSYSHPASLPSDNYYSQFWKPSIVSLVSNYTYDIDNKVCPVITESRDLYMVHSLTGTLLGTYKTFQEACTGLPPGLYIINNRKTVIR